MAIPVINSGEDDPRDASGTIMDEMMLEEYLLERSPVFSKLCSLRDKARQHLDVLSRLIICRHGGTRKAICFPKVKREVDLSQQQAAQKLVQHDNSDRKRYGTGDQCIRLYKHEAHVFSIFVKQRL